MQELPLVSGLSSRLLRAAVLTMVQSSESNTVKVTARPGVMEKIGGFVAEADIAEKARRAKIRPHPDPLPQGEGILILVAYPGCRCALPWATIVPPLRGIGMGVGVAVWGFGVASI